jgi:hypothetical protein
LLTCPPCSAPQDLQLSSELSKASAPSDIVQRSDSASRAPHDQHALFRPKSGLQPHPNSLLHSASSPRSKLIFETGSVSDSGVASRTPRSSACLDVSLAHMGRPSLLDVRHHSPSSPNLTLPGYLSDSCIPERSASPLHASRLDVKRLLSKPAAPSVASALSIASDTDPESHALSRSPLYSSKAWPSKARVQAQPKPRIDPPTISRSESHERKSLATPPPSLEQRPRVLRKKSTSGQHRVVTSAVPRNDTSTLSPLQSNQLPVAGPSGSQRSTALQSLIRSRVAVSPSAPPSGSGRLTPAGAIAQAYKEQGIRREALAAAANADILLPAIPVSGSLLDSFEHATLEQNTTANVKSALCCIGPRDSSDSFVLVDGAQEAPCSGIEHSPCVAGSGDPSASASASRPAKLLTRKVSAPLQRGLASVTSSAARSGRGQTDDDTTPASHLRGNIDNADRSERQRSLSLHKAKHKTDSPGLSLKPPVHSSDTDDSLGKRLRHSPQDDSASNSTSVIAESKGKEKVQEKGDTGTGARLWRLVKRISTGGLRERFQTANAPPPPVPTIPKESTLLPNAMLEVQPPSESTSRDGGTDVGCSAGGVGLIDSGDVSPQSDGHTSLQGNGAGSHPRRPSISSSPQSSEPTTSIHFFRSHSSRSSFSSFVGTSPPPPVPKHSLARSSSLQTRSRTKTNSSSSTQGTSQDEAQRSISPSARTRNRSSPDIPTFSISDVVNNFMLRRPSLVRHQARQTRHAPARSLPGNEPPAGEVSRALLRRAGSEARSTMRKHRRFDPILAPVSSGQNRDSHGSDSTLRPPGSITGSVVERFTFRELGSARGEALTSQEKEDKWDDLLERSARAGGTLHLGVGSSQLASDNLRFSSSTLELDT